MPWPEDPISVCAEGRQGAGLVRNKYKVLGKGCEYAPPQNLEEPPQKFILIPSVSPGDPGRYSQAELPSISKSGVSER